MLVVSIRPAVIAAAALAGLSLAGCTSLKGHNGYIIDADLVNSVQPGVDNRETVVKVLGKPTFTSQFDERDWFYLSRDTKYLGYTKPKPTAQQTLRIRFDDKGVVTKIEKTGMEQVASISPSKKVTPTLGRHRSFFQDLFGNIGTVGTGTGGQGDGGGRDTP